MIALAVTDLWSVGIPAPVALAAVAVIGYLFGQRTRKPAETPSEQARHEMKRGKPTCPLKRMPTSSWRL